MYQVAELVKVNFDFSTVHIPNRDKIVAQTGRELDLPHAVVFLQRITREFTEENAQARQADELIAELVMKSELQKLGNAPVDPAGDAGQSDKDLLLEAIEGFRTALEFLDDPSEIAMLQEAIEGYETALEFV